MTSQLITLTGNLTGAPELRFGGSGTAVCRLNIACNDRYRDAQGQWQDGATHFQRATAFGVQAENIAASLNRGDRVVVTGKLVTSSYEHTDDDGVKSQRYSTDFHIEDCAVSVRWAEVRVQRAVRRRDVVEVVPSSVPDEWTAEPAAAASSSKN